MIPEEDRGPAWLADYGAIEADIQAMEDFAAGLASEVSKGYDPHFDQVAAEMTIMLPKGDPRFPEMVSFLEQHHRVQLQTFNNTYYFSPGTLQAASAAGTISAEYGKSDAYAHATVSDVKDAFDQAARTGDPHVLDGGGQS